MASFDIMEATSFGYRMVWRERRYLAYLAAVPMLIKFICHMTVVMLGWQDQFMRQGLIMLPSYFADGWMLSHLVRLIFLDQRWPFRRTGDAQNDRVQLEDRASGVMAGTLAFVVVEFMMAGFIDALYQLSLVAIEMHANPSLSVTIFMALCAAGLLWLFRYFWFYIPAAVHYPLPHFSMAMKGYRTSVYMLAVWLGCIVPGIMTYKILAGAFITPAPQNGKYMGVEFLSGLTGVALDTVISFIVTAAMAHAIQAMIVSWQQDRH